MLEKANAAIDREERVEAVEELKTLVEDWKGHRIEGFGELLLHGQFTVLKGESISSKNEEREVSNTNSATVISFPFTLQLCVNSISSPYPPDFVNSSDSV